MGALTDATPPPSVSGDMRRWLCSGIPQTADGAFVAWRDRDSGSLAFEYPEINGYALTYLASRPDLTEQENAVGHRAARWLVERLAKGERSARAGWDGGAVYTFDLAMIATGLMMFGARTSCEEYAHHGLLIVNGLCADAAAEGRMPATAADSPASARRGWSVDGRASLLKVVQALLLGGQLGASGAAETARDLITEAERAQKTDGRFQTEEADRITMLHPHLYAAEGLWMWATAMRDERRMNAARVAVDWAWTHQLGTGGLPRFVAVSGDELGSAPEQFDLTAQAIRLALLLGRRDSVIVNATARLASTLLSSTAGSSLPYQPDAEAQHENVWVTLFGAQAFELSEMRVAHLVWTAFV